MVITMITNPIPTTAIIATTIPLILFPATAAWITSPSHRSIVHKTASILNTGKLSLLFVPQKLVTHRIHMNTFSNDNDINFQNKNNNQVASSSSSSMIQNTTIVPKKSPIGRPAFGQVRHRPKFVSSQMNAPPSTIVTNTNTKPTITTTRPPQQQIMFPPGREKKMNSDGSITSLHTSRIQNAGRVGTKRYINPCKVYFGNLSYQIKDKSILQNFVVEQMGLPVHIILKECNIVTDWKTQQSKGYGFVIFTEPIYATIAITKLHGTNWYNRTITVNQGVHKQNMEELQTIYQNAYRKQQIRLEEEQNSNGNKLDESEDEIVYMDAKEAALLKHLDPDLLVGVQIIPTATNAGANDKSSKATKSEKKQNSVTNGKQSKIIITNDDVSIETIDVHDDNYDIEYDNDDNDNIEYDYDDDEIYVDDISAEIDENYDDDEDYDYDYEMDDNDDELSTSNNDTNDETSSTSKNRQQRRDDAKSKKKIKLPHKGFG